MFGFPTCGRDQTRVCEETDGVGFRTIQNRAKLPDRHATILSLLGLDHERVTCRDTARDSLLTDTG